MSGSGDEWESLTNKELHTKFAKLVIDNTQDIDKRLGEALEKITGLEQSFDTKLDAKFNELLARLPPPPAAAPRRPGYVGYAQRVPREQGQNSGVAAAVDEPFDYYEGEDEYEGVEVQQHHQVGRAPTFVMVMLHHALRYCMMMTMLLN